MSLFGRLKRWLGLGGSDESARDAGTPPRRRTTAETGTNREAVGGDAAGSVGADAGIPEAESETGGGPSTRTEPALKCSVCGTDVDAGAAACPLCKSTDLRPAGGTASPDLTPGRAMDPSEEASAFVEEAEADGHVPDTGPNPSVPSATDATATETTPDGPDDGSEATGDAGDDSSGERASEPPSASDVVEFSGPGPTETRARTSETDDEAVNRLQELRRRGESDEEDGAR